MMTYAILAEKAPGGGAIFSKAVGHAADDTSGDSSCEKSAKVLAAAACPGIYTQDRALTAYT